MELKIQNGIEVEMPNGEIVVFDGCGETGEESEMFTRMFAASLDLFAACDAAEDLLAGYDQTPAEREVFQKLRAALAKAQPQKSPTAA